MKNKNIKLLKEFTKYCIAHPEERLWQALRSWSGFAFIYATNKIITINKEDSSELQDTFYFEGKDR